MKGKPKVQLNKEESSSGSGFSDDEFELDFDEIISQLNLQLKDVFLGIQKLNAEKGKQHVLAR